HRGGRSRRPGRAVLLHPNLRAPVVLPLKAGGAGVRFAACVWLAASAAMAQSAAPPQMVRGSLLEWNATAATGEFSIRTIANQVYRFSFDNKPYFERENRRCTLNNFQKGDQVEIVSERAAGPSVAYARTVHGIEKELPKRTISSLGRYRALAGSADRIVPPVGSLTWSGVVARVNGGHIVL